MPASRRRRNPGVVYSGLVGSRLRPRKQRREPVRFDTHTCVGGPLHGKKYRAELRTGDTLEFVLKGSVGRYVFGRWEPHQGV